MHLKHDGQLGKGFSMVHISNHVLESMVRNKHISFLKSNYSHTGCVEIPNTKIQQLTHQVNVLETRQHECLQQLAADATSSYHEHLLFLFETPKKHKTSNT